MTSTSAFKKLTTTWLLIAFCWPVFGQQTLVQYLSGTDKDNAVPWEFMIDKGMNSGKWTTIPVPSNWELQGFGVYNYGRQWPEKQPPSDETGYYRHTFTVPQAWKGRAVRIVFEGVMTDTEVKINGKLAGPVHQGSFYRFRYDISGLITYGKPNRIEVKVRNWSANQSVNKAEREADYWLFGGIYRPVYLEALPSTYLEQISFDAKADGSFSLHAEPVKAPKGAGVKVQIEELDGRIVATSSTAMAEGRPVVQVDLKANGIRPWSSEFPNRYRARVHLLDAKGGVLHEVTDVFGFRTVELRPQDGLYINGERIVLKGVNRHSFWPESGRCTSRAISEMDARLLKEMNMNAVRMSHYPPDKHFLEVCDSVGLYVLNELAGWQDAYDTQVGEKLVKAMVRRDVNHPSVIIWDNGNEGGNNHDLVDDYHLYDPQKRPVIHPWNNFNGIETAHYKPYDCCVGMLFQGRDVFFPTEFLHGIYDGGHGAGLEDYWERIISHPLGSGGFLWCMTDEGVVRTDRNGAIDTQGSNAPDGILGPYREKEGSYYTIRELWAPVMVKLKHLPPTFNGSLRVENRYHFTNLNQCSFAWKLERLPGLYGRKAQTETGKASAPDVAPGQAGYLSLSLPEGFLSAYDVLSLTIAAPHGQEVMTYTWPLPGAHTSQELAARPASSQAVTLQETPEAFLLGNGKITVTISKLNGTIEKVANGQKEIPLGEGPRVAIGAAKLKTLTPDPARKQVVADFEGSQKKIIYSFTEEGLLGIQATYQPEAGKAYDFLGLDFTFPEELVTGVTWKGRGPYRVWKNRMRGQAFGVWKKEYNNTVTGESWLYPEFKGYHADFRWVVVENKVQNFAVLTDTPNIFLKLYNPQPPKGAYNRNTDGVFSQGDISFLHAISPIGTKFLRAEQLGPQGQKNQVYQVGSKHPFQLSMSLYFDFDLP